MFHKEEIKAIDDFLQGYFDTLILTSRFLEDKSNDSLEKVNESLKQLKEISDNIKHLEDVSSHSDKSDKVLFNRISILFSEEILKTTFRNLADYKDPKQRHWKNFMFRGVSNEMPVLKDMWNCVNTYLGIHNRKLPYYFERLFSIFNSFHNSFDTFLDYEKRISKDHIEFMRGEFDKCKKDFVDLLEKS